MPIWFLFSLFLTQMFCHFLFRYSMVYLSILLPFIGYILDVCNIELLFGLNTIFLGSTFYIAGYYYKYISRYHGLLAWISMVFFIFLLLCKPSAVDFRINHLFYGNYFAFILYSIFGIILFLSFSIMLGLSDKIGMGKNSLIFFLIHWPIIILCRDFFSVNNFVMVLICYIAIYIAYFAINPILKRYSWLIGKV